MQISYIYIYMATYELVAEKEVDHFTLFYIQVVLLLTA